MKKVAVFLSAKDVSEVYEKPMLELVRELVSSGYVFVYGGTEQGMMKKAADEVRAMGGKIVAVCAEEFKSKWREDVDERIVCSNIPERKKKLAEVSDAIILLPGGSGSLDEFTEVFETKKWGDHNKILVILNSAGYWNELLNLFNKMKNEDFLDIDFNKLVYVASDPGEAVNYLKSNLKN